MGDNAGIERLPQRSDREETSFHDIYESASNVSRRVLESIQALAGTTNCKGVQIHELEKWAHANGFWFEDIKSLGVFADRGSENEVYISNSGKEVIKLNDFRYSDDNLTPFFERIQAHNYYFPNCSLTLVGFAKNQQNKTCAVLVQPLIVADREATPSEIKIELEKCGFISDIDAECFSNGYHDIFDALPNNVLVGIDCRLYFIDTIIYKSSKSNLKTYRSQSPRFSK